MLHPVLLSELSGYLSIFCWVIVFTPQLWENYKRKSGEGLSMTFLVIWLAGDLFNLIGVILQQLLPTMFLLALWYTVADMGLIWQIIYYRQTWKRVNEDEFGPAPPPSAGSSESEPLLVSWRVRRESEKISNFAWSGVFWPICIAATMMLSFYGYFFSDLIHRHTNGDLQVMPQVLGWSSATLYVGSRIPQIIKNHAKKSTDGLSLGMFICAVFGNVFFTLSIFLNSIDPHYLLINLSWIIGAVGTLVFDFIIFIQFFVYKKNKPPSPHQILQN